MAGLAAGVFFLCRASSLVLGGEGRGECGAHGCRLGTDGRGDLARHGRPAWRAALARLGGRAVLASEYQTVRLVGPLLGRPAVSGSAVRERPRHHREDATRAQPSVVMGCHDPDYRQYATMVAGGRAQGIGRGQVVKSYSQPPRGP